MARDAEDMVARRDGVPRARGEVARRRAWLGACPAGRVVSFWAVAVPTLLAFAGTSAAADSPATVPTRTGKLPGLISGLLLLALLCYSVYVYAAPLLKDCDRSILRALVILSGVAIIKILLLPWFDGYHNDIVSYESWALQMASEGPAGIYRTGYFLDYPPGYLYALWLAG